MNEYERFAQGIADLAGWGLLVLVAGGFIVALVVAALFVERLLPPRVDRHRDFRNLSANKKGRRQMATERSR